MCEIWRIVQYQNKKKTLKAKKQNPKFATGKTDIKCRKIRKTPCNAVLYKDSFYECSCVVESRKVVRVITSQEICRDEMSFHLLPLRRPGCSDKLKIGDEHSILLQKAKEQKC